MSPISILTFLGVGFLLPLLFCYWLGVGRADSRLAWLLQLLGTGSFVLYWLVAGRWDWIGYPARVLVFALLLVSALASARRLPGLPGFPSTPPDWLGSVVFAVIGAAFGLLLIMALAGYSYRGRAVALRFPFRDGIYYVGQGGASPIINHHNVYLPQRYAMDIGKLNWFGTRARGFYPSDLTDYEIFDQPIVSPCSGTVLHSEGALDDHQPPQSDPDQPPGNHVLLDCRGTRVYLAHMRSGSVLVREGQRVDPGQPLGHVGNSGNTTEPHLHLHAEDASGAGVPITFRGRFLVRNSLFRAGD